MDQLKVLIDELYKIIKEYEQEKSDRLDYRIQALYSQVDVLEALKDGTTEEYLKQWHRCLLEDKPRKL